MNDKINQLCDDEWLSRTFYGGTTIETELVIKVGDLKALVSELDRKTRALERIAGVSSGYPCACEEIA